MRFPTAALAVTCLTLALRCGPGSVAPHTEPPRVVAEVHDAAQEPVGTPVDPGCEKGRALRTRATSLSSEGRLAAALRALGAANQACPAEAAASHSTELAALLELGRLDEAKKLAAVVLAQPEPRPAARELAERARSASDPRSPAELLAEGRRLATSGLSQPKNADQEARRSLDRAAVLIERATHERVVLEPGFALRFIREVRWSPDGKTIAVADEGDVVLLDAVDLRPAAVLGLGRPETPVIALWYAAGGTLLGGASYSAYAKLWDPENGAVRAETTLSAYPPMSVAISPDATLLAEVTDHSAEGGNTVLELAALGKTPEDTEWRWSKKVKFHQVAFSPDGKSLLATGDGRVQLLDVQKGRPQRSFGVPKVSRTVMSSNQRLIVALARSSSVKVLDVSGKAPPRTLAGHRQEVNAAAISPDSKLLLTGASDKSFRLWDLSTWATLHEQAVDGEIWSVAFSPDGMQMAIGFESRLELWDRRSWSSRASARAELQCRAGWLLFPRELCDDGVDATVP